MHLRKKLCGVLIVNPAEIQRKEVSMWPSVVKMALELGFGVGEVRDVKKPFLQQEKPVGKVTGYLGNWLVKL